MAKQLNINLGFTADISQAKMQIMDLQNSLNSLVQGSITSKNLPITKELTEAQSAAAALKVALESAINTQTGKLDLSRFSESINKSGLDLKTLQGHLQALGPAGTQTFQSLASSIMQAEIPLTRSNMLVSQLWTTLKNTARWQLSSSMMHSFIGTIQGAVGYAKDLNESLNNIRIVTGASIEEMARFAEQANRSAKALNATTTAYTNASLIYYQQGLSADEVQKRTDVTIKMANVSRQSAETVSDQMTAVWNNFAKGGENLERFADVMVRLGADTASSSDEIAQGLEKFAAIGDMVGLSFDNAAAALATVTATTRQSADVVGTAFKTIFARIQGLKLGETLEDGTDLNKYSEALAAVGISIKEQNGELKDMDNILAEMGAKWKTLSKDQQVALAQTVAGLRQYNQLVALMENFDFYEQNLQSAKNAEGSLQEQADIYAESWEAARDRVKTSAQDIYDSLLNDDFFISLLDGFAGLLDLIGTFVDSLGGLQGVLALVGTIMTKVFGEQMAASIERLVYNVKSLTGANQRAAQKLQEEAYQRASTMHYDDGTETGAATADAMKSQLDLQNSLIGQSSKMTEQERQRYQLLLDTNKAYGEQAIAAAKVADAAQQAIQNSSRDLRREAMRNGTSREDYDEARGKMKRKAKIVVDADTNVKKINKEFQGAEVTQYTKLIDKLNNSLKGLGKSNATANAIKKLNSDFKNGKIDSEEYKRRLNELATSGELVDDAVMDMSDAFRTSVPSLQNATTAVDNMAQQEIDAVVANNNLSQSQQALSANTNNVKIAIQGFKAAMSGYATVIVSAFNGISQLTMGISSLKSIWDTLNNSDMSFGEKVLSIMMSLSMAIPALIGGYEALAVAKEKDGVSTIKQLGIGLANIAQKGVEVVKNAAVATSEFFLSKAKDAETGSVQANTAAWLANPIMWIALIIIGVVAAVTALVVGIWALSNALTSEEQEAKKAAQTAEELSAAYDECASAYQEMIDTMSQYEEARNSLNQLVEGTDEYKDALQKANRAALELIQNNPGKFIAGKDYSWQGNQLVISDDAIKRAKTEGQKKVNTMYAAKQVGSAKADIKQSKVDATNVERKITEDGFYTLSEKNKDIIDRARNLYTEDQNLFTNKDYMAQQLNLDVTNKADQRLIEALWDNRDEMINLGNTTKAAADSYTLATENAVRELLGDNEKVQTSANKEEIIEASSQEYQDSYQQELDRLEREGWGTSGISKASGAGNQKAKDVFNDYAEAAGLEGVDLIDVIGSDKARSFKYVDSEGQEKTVSLEAMREVMAASAANDSTDKIATNLAEMVNAFDTWVDDLNSGKIIGKDGMTAGAAEETKNFVLNKDFSKASKQDLSDIRKQIGETGENTKDYLGNLFGGTDNILDDAEAQKYGYDTAKEFVDAFNKGIEDAEKNWESLKIPEGLNQPADIGYEAAQNISNTYNDIVKGDSMNNFESVFGGEDGFISDEEAKALGAETATALRTGFQEAIANGEESAISFLDNLVGQLPEGEAREKGQALAENLKSGISEGFAQGQQFIENINAILDTVAAEDKAVAYEALANIDWSKWDASKVAIDALGELGVSSEKTDQKIKELEGSMRDINDAAKDFGEVNTALDKDIDTEEYEALAKHLKSVAKESEELSDDLAYNEKAAKKVSEAILRFDNAIQDVNDNYEDWIHTLKSGSLQDQAKVANQLSDAYADMLDIDIGSLSDDFIMNADNLELMKEAANGSEEAYRQLQQVAGQDILAQCGIDTSQYFTDLAAIEAAALEAEGMGLADIEAGASLDNANFLQSLSDIVNAAGMTAQQATDYLSSMGIDAEVTTAKTEEPVSRTVNDLTPHITYQDATIPVVAGEGSVENQTVKVPRINYQADSRSITDTVAGGGVSLKVTSATKSSGGGFKFKNSSRGGGSKGSKGGGGKGGGGGGGGGGGNTNPAKKSKLTKRTDIVERHHHVNKALETQENIIDRLNKQLDKLYGKNRLKQIQKIIEALRERNNIEQWYIEDAKKYEEIDKNALIDFYNQSFKRKYKETNRFVELVINPDGSIGNLEQIQEGIADVLNSYETKNNQFATQEEQEVFKENVLEPFQDLKEDFDYLVDLYYTSREQRLDMEAQNQGTKIEIQELILDKIVSNIELKTEIEDTALEVIDYYMSKIEDDVYKTAEAIELLGDRYDHIVNKASLAYKRYNDILWEIGNNPELENNIDYLSEQINEAIPEIISAMQDLQETDQEMMEYYGNFLEKASEEFEKYTIILESGIDKLEVYKNLLSLTGREMNYDAMEVVLKGQLGAIKNSVSSYKEYYDFMNNEYTALYNRWLKEKDTLDKKELELLEKKLYDAQIALDEAEANWLDSLEQQGEIAQEILENNLAKARKTFENYLMEETFGEDSYIKSIEDYIEKIDRLANKQEEYLTKTNQLYETNKLLNQAQLAIDKTTNNQAKQQYKNYMKNIEELQKQSKISQQDLAIAQAKFEILQAEIALKEAQDAKNQVRLTRDAEGNYGYIYTANQDDVANAEQEYADKQNALYNIGLEGVKNYQSQYAQTMQEAIETFESINEQYRTGQIASETEYNQKMQEAQKYYYNLLKTYNDEYYTALDLLVEESSTNRADYTQTDIINLSDFKDATDQYLEDASDSFDEYETNTKEVSETVGKDLTTLKNNTEKVTKKSDELGKEINNDLIPNLEDEALAVREVTSEWGAQRDEIYLNIAAYEKMIERLQQVQYYLNGGQIDDYSIAMAKHLSAGGSVTDAIYKNMKIERGEKASQEGYELENKNQILFNWLMEEYEKGENQKVVDYVNSVIDSNGLWDYDIIKQLNPNYQYGDIFKFAANNSDKFRTTSYSIDVPANLPELFDKIEELIPDVPLTSEIYQTYINSSQKAEDLKKYNITPEEVSELIKKQEDIKEMREIIRHSLGELSLYYYDRDVLNTPENRATNTKEKEALINYILNIIEDNEIFDFETLKNLVIADKRRGKKYEGRFDTGGYTGSWGPEGRLAVLHEKELVLNKQDTENFLSATAMLREISQMLDNNALAASLGMINLRAMTIDSPADQIFQQEVTIHADFPNVTDHNEIEIAIDNLINAASQHAYKV